MPPLTPRQAVCALIDSSSEFTGKPAWELWKSLYSAFESEAVTNTKWRVLAYNACQTPLDYLEENQKMGDLLSFARGFLPQKPKA